MIDPTMLAGLAGLGGGGGTKVDVNQNSSNTSSSLISSAITNVLGGDADNKTGSLSAEQRGEAIQRNKPDSSSGYLSSLGVSGGSLGTTISKNSNTMFWAIGGLVLGGFGLLIYILSGRK